MAPRFRQSFSALLAVVFMAQLAFASAPESNFWAERRRLQSEPSVVNQLPPIAAAWPARSPGNWPQKFQTLLDSIPPGAGSIQDVYDSLDDKNPPVVLLQDVHMNAEAQANIAEILRSLIERRQVGLVGIEGAFSRLDFARFRAFPNKKITKDVADAFVRKNLLAAASHAGITSSVEPPPFVGVDDAEHYAANVKAYLASRGSQKQTAEKITAIERVLAQAKKNIFSPELMRFDALRAARDKGGLGFGAYVKQLAAGETELDLAVAQFLEAYGMETTLDFARVERERRTVIEALTKTMNARETADLVARSLAYRLGRSSFGAYHQGLKNLCEQKGVPLSRTPAFANYVRYVLLSDGIKAEALFAGVAQLEKNILARLAKTPDEKKLADLSERVALTGKLAGFGLTSAEWDAYRSGGSPSGLFSPQMNFYREADIRSRTMVEKLLAQPTKQTRMLVLGGFHTPQAARLLRERKISYVVVSPKITKLESGSDSSYLSVFAREKTPLEKLFVGEKLFLKPGGMEVVPGEPLAEVLLPAALGLAQKNGRLDLGGGLFAAKAVEAGFTKVADVPGGVVERADPEKTNIDESLRPGPRTHTVLDPWVDALTVEDLRDIDDELRQLRNQKSRGRLDKEGLRRIWTMEMNQPLTEEFPEFLPGQEVGGHKIVKRLNKGAFGTVYLAEKNGEQVALKVVSLRENTKHKVRDFILTAAHLKQEGIQLANINAEVDAKNLDSRHIPRSKEHGFDREIKRSYLAMEYVEGKDLETIFETEGLKLSHIVALVKAVKWLHEAGFLHRDLKPANAMLDENGSVILLDVATAVKIGTTGGMEMSPTDMTGTPLYKSYLLNNRSERSDLYSIGVILGFWLYGAKDRIDYATLRTLADLEFRLEDENEASQRAVKADEVINTLDELIDQKKIDTSVVQDPDYFERPPPTVRQSPPSDSSAASLRSGSKRRQITLSPAEELGYGAPLGILSHWLFDRGVTRRVVFWNGWWTVIAFAGLGAMAAGLAAGWSGPRGLLLILPAIPWAWEKGRIFAEAHRGRSPPQREFLRALGFRMSLLTVTPVFWAGIYSWEGLIGSAAGLALNYAFHALTNFFELRTPTLGSVASRATKKELKMWVDSLSYENIINLNKEMMEVFEGNRAVQAALGRLEPSSPNFKAQVENAWAVAADQVSARKPIALEHRRIGPFTVLGAVDSGGFGVIYKAENKKTGEQIAIKTAIYKEETISGLELIRVTGALMLEADNLRLMQKAGIERKDALFPWLLASGFDRNLGRNYLAMNYLTGTNMSRLFKAKGLLLEDIVKIYQALEQVHLKFVHRDARFANFMKAENEDVSIFDFGTAVSLDLDENQDWPSDIVGDPDSPVPGSINNRSVQYDLYLVQKYILRKWITALSESGAASSVIQEALETIAKRAEEESATAHEIIAALNELIKDHDFLKKHHVVYVTPVIHEKTTHRHAQKSTPSVSMAADFAEQLLSIVKDPGNGSARVEALSRLIGSEKIFGDGKIAGSGKPTVRWEEMKTALSAMVANGDLNPAQVADLAFLLRFVLSDEEYHEFVALAELPAKDEGKDVRGSVFWTGDFGQAKRLILGRPGKAGERIVVGLDDEKTPDLKQRLMADHEIQAWVKAGAQLDFVERTGLNILSLVELAKRKRMFEGERDFKLNVLVLEGMVLPPYFFNLDENKQSDLRREAVVYFVTQGLQAVKIDVSLLPDWNELRRRLVQA